MVVCHVVVSRLVGERSLWFAVNSLSVTLVTLALCICMVNRAVTRAGIGFVGFLTFFDTNLLVWARLGALHVARGWCIFRACSLFIPGKR